MRRGGVERLYEEHERSAELDADRLRLLALGRFARVVDHLLLLDQLAHQFVGAPAQHPHLLLHDRVAVLLQKTRALVRDAIGKVHDDERRVARPGLLEIGVLFALFVHFIDPALVGAFGDAALFVQQVEHAQRLLDQVDTRLIVVVVDEGPVELLAHVLLLFQLENVLIELLLQLLVGVVDAELFETVDLERFEAVDVQDADEAVRVLRPLQSLVDQLHHHGEEQRIDVLGQRVPGVRCFRLRHGLAEHLLHADYLSIAQIFLHVRAGLSVQAHQRAEGLERRVLLLDAAPFALRLQKFDVSRVQHRRYDREKLFLHRFGKVEEIERFARLQEVAHVVDAGDEGAVALARVLELGLVPQLQVAHFGQFLRRGAQLVENVVVALLFRLEHHS